MHISPEQQKQENKHRQFLRSNPGSISEHIVCVIDQSGSMKKSDMPGARNRSMAVFASILLDVLLNSIVSGQGDSDDVLTLIDMREDATVLLDREPLDVVTYNKIVAMMTEVQPGGQGYFIPALEKLYEILVHDSKQGLEHKVHVMFLTDGRPSDRFVGEDSHIAVLRLSKAAVRRMAQLLPGTASASQALEAGHRRSLTLNISQLLQRKLKVRGARMPLRVMLAVLSPS